MITDPGDWSGWNDTINKAIIEINNLDPDAELLQIKTKFGGLRFYVSSTNPQVQDIARRAERETAKICYKCGEVDRPGIGEMKGSFYMTSVMLCNECAKDKYKD